LATDSLVGEGIKYYYGVGGIVGEKPDTEMKKMTKTYRHVYTFEGTRPLDKVKSVETYERLKDVPECGENQMMSSGQNKTPMCTDITCGTFQVQISVLNNVMWTIEGATKFVENLEYNDRATSEEVKELEDSKKKALEFLHGNEYGKKEFGKLNPMTVEIKSRVNGD
jgi:hypothetical protein